MFDHGGRCAPSLRSRVLTHAALLGRDAYRAWTTITLRWADADRYGHVNNAVHYQWFDDAVNGWLIAAGLLDLAGDGPVGFVVETGCRYARPIDFPGAVEIGLVVEHIGTSSIRYRLGVFKDGDTASTAEGHFIHVYVDRASRRPRPLSNEWREMLAALSPS